MAVPEKQHGPRTALRAFALPALRLLGGVGTAAVATYVYLVVVAREVGPEAYASFSVFWAVVVIAGAGVYLPIEQETARRGVDVRSGRKPRPLSRSAIGAAAVVTALFAGLLLAAWPVAAEFFGGEALLGWALALGAVGYAAQYPVRGLLSARRLYGWYATVLGTEAVLRIVLVVGLVWLAEPSGGALAVIVGAAALGSALVGLVGARDPGGSVPGGTWTFLRSVGVLVAGAAALQTLLYGGVLVARLLAPAGQEAVTGQLLAAITVTRIPVFLFQSLEALVVPRIAELAVRGDVPALRTAVRRLVLAVGSLAVVTALGSFLIGPGLVSLMFGADFVVSHTVMGLLGLGTGAFMLAVAASDVTVALGGHRAMAGAWVAGLLGAALSVFLLPALVLQVTVPLLVGSAVAAVLLTREARGRIGRLLPG